MPEQSGNRPSPGSRETDDERSVPVSNKLSGSLLSQIVEYSELEVGEEQANAEIEKALLSVAAEHSAKLQLDEEVLQDLVKVLLREVHSLDLPVNSRMVQWVTQTLYSDPNARLRLERLWVQLSGRIEHGS